MTDEPQPLTDEQVDALVTGAIGLLTAFFGGDPGWGLLLPFVRRNIDEVMEIVRDFQATILKTDEGA